MSNMLFARRCWLQCARDALQSAGRQAISVARHAVCGRFSDGQVVSRAFEGVSKLQRQRMVQESVMTANKNSDFNAARSLETHAT